MNPLRRLKTALLLAAMVFIAGCASPHYLQPNPKLSAELPPSGSGQQVTLNVLDERESEVLGTRTGSAMSTATITVNAHEVVPKLKTQAERALREMGFTPTDQAAPNRPSLTLSLAKLGYERGETKPLIDEARLEAILQAVVINGNTKYTGRYTSRHTQGYAIRPSLEANTRMVNDMLSDALNRTFSDPKIGSILAR
ncbi:YajG family lipoprotein [Pistricoccus aurantiacus]|uniref:Lipoprotein n=1 Tax=Pistricoccus aurantiacus TaxID=1883414 RepID=A0A5B8T1V2_9GAMM|nr:YajG family lipoprotein [Pistricoccus aurantiacus]QEA40990.1 hypothetical protein FGL86_15940 [Pistricoccus aurantiacus]